MTMPLAWSLLSEEMGSPVLFVTLGSLAGLVIGVTKAGFGSGAGVLAGPLMIYACGGQTALALGIQLPVHMACDVVAVLGWWGRWDRKQFWMLLPGTIGGIALGAGVLYGFQRLDAGRHESVTDACLMLGIGLIALGFIVLRILRGRGREGQDVYQPKPRHGASVGVAAGLTSTLTHAAGPITTMYLLPQQMPKGRYVATTVAYYWAVNLIKLPPYAMLGMVDTSSLGASALLLPSVVAGAGLGILLHRRFGQRSFLRIVHVLLAVAGLHLCYKALIHLLQQGS